MAKDNRWCGRRMDVVGKQKDMAIKGLRAKQKQVFILLLLITLTAVFFLVGASQKRSSIASEPLIVNGHTASAEQFGMYLGLKKALVADYFKQTYGAEYTDQFWTTSYSGEMPLQRLIDEAKAELTKTIALQQLAKKSGIAVDGSYVSFHSGMEAENSRRSKAAADGEIVYGPTSFEIEAYYSYYMSNLESATLEAMQKSGKLSVPDDKVKQAYETDKQTKYSLPRHVKLKWAVLPYGDGAALINKNEALRVMEQLKKAAVDQASFIDSAKQLAIEVMDASLTSATRRTAALESPIAVQQAERIQADQLSDIFEENGELNLLYCISKGEPILQSYEKVKDAIASELMSEQFREIAQQESRLATVEWDNERAERLARSWLGITKL